MMTIGTNRLPSGISVSTNIVLNLYERVFEMQIVTRIGSYEGSSDVWR